MTKIKLEFVLDPDMYIFEKGTRGGCLCIYNSKANIEYLKSCDPQQESKHIIYLYT